MSELYRSFHPDLQVRSNGEGRTIYGIAVPYNAPMRIDNTLVEQFARGAFNHQLRAANRVKFAREHLALGGTLIGALQNMRDDTAGLYVEMRAARTPVGDETIELVKEGALNHLSVGFRERENRRCAGNVIERVRADLFEVAIVLEGAYGDAAMAAGVRSAGAASLTGAYREPGEMIREEEAELRAKAAQFLDGGLPDLSDDHLRIRALELGMTWV